MACTLHANFLCPKVLCFLFVFFPYTSSILHCSLEDSHVPVQIRRKDSQAFDLHESLRYRVENQYVLEREHEAIR